MDQLVTAATEHIHRVVRTKSLAMMRLSDSGRRIN
jgi:hypothetical protein